MNHLFNWARSRTLPSPADPSIEVLTMTREELNEAIYRTSQEIDQLKKQIEQATDPREVRQLQRRLKELQYYGI